MGALRKGEASSLGNWDRVIEFSCGPNPQLDCLARVSQGIFIPVAMADACDAVMDSKDAFRLIPYLLKLLREGNFYNYQQPAARGLGRLGADKGFPILLAIARDQDVDQQARRCAIEALAEYGSKDLVPDLLALPKDNSLTVCNALVTLDAVEAIPQLKQLMESPNKGARMSARYALIRLKALDAGEVARGLIGSPVKDDRRWAITVLSEPGRQDGLLSLIPLLKDPTRRIRHEVAEALVKGKDPATLADIRTFLRDEKDSTRWFAAYVLARLGDASGKDLLGQMAKMENLYWRHRGEEGLAALEGGEVRPLIRASDGGD